MGAFGHLGLNALQIATAMRAKQLAPSPTPFRDASGDRIGMALARALPDDLVGVERLIALAIPALREAAAGARRDDLPLFLALPHAGRPDFIRDASVARGLVQAIAERAGVAVDVGASRTFPHGHAGFAAAAELARRWLSGGEGREALVGGVDSAFDPLVAELFDARGWIAKEERDGARIPGEAAAFVRLAELPAAKGRSMARLAAAEFEPPDGSTPPGLLLGKLLRRVGRATTEGRLSWLIPDLNGERDRSMLFGEASHHALDLVHGIQLDELAQHCGDTGAATGALLTAIVAELWRMGGVGAQNAAITTSSDDGDQGVTVWDRPRTAPGVAPKKGAFHASLGGARKHVLGPAKGALSPTPEERAQMEAVARMCLDDVGSMGLLLGPNPESDDADAATFAQRMLDAYDAFAALGVGRPGATFLPDLRQVARAYANEARLTPPRKYALDFVETILFGGS